MAHMMAWLLASVALLPPLAMALAMCGNGAIGQRFAAVQLAGSLSALLLVILTFVLDQASSIDLALTLAILTLPSTLLFALFLERWL